MKSDRKLFFIRPTNLLFTNILLCSTATQRISLQKEKKNMKEVDVTLLKNV